MELQETVADGQLLVAALIALAAGLISFLSPCVLPLIPGYLAYVGGVAGGGGAAGSGGESGAGARPARGRLVAGVLLFIAGFSAVFVAMTSLFGTVGVWLLEWQDLITRVLGAIVIAMGLVFVGLFGAAQRTVRLGLRPRVGLLGAPLLGIVFAVGWSPCFGPTLITINALALQSESAGRAAILGLAYCLGLGIPFVLAAFGFGWMTTATAFFKRHIRAVNVIGGVLLILIGLLMVTGLWGRMINSMQGVIDGFVPAI